MEKLHGKKARRKRLNDPITKAKILAAAQRAFAEVGYGQAGIRQIAAIAGVSSALLLRYFGSKAGLFEAALVDVIPLDAVLPSIKRDQFGAQVADMILGGRVDVKSPSIIALAIGHADTRKITTRVTEQHVLEPLAKWLGPPDAKIRALQLTMLSMSFELYTRQLPVAASIADKQAKLRTWFAKTLQAIVDLSHGADVARVHVRGQ